MSELAIDPRKVGGAFSVDESARRIMHYRFAENVCMTTGSGWASSMLAIKVKFALGEHCYHDSVHSFWLGQRLPELRVTERWTRNAADAALVVPGRAAERSVPDVLRDDAAADGSAPALVGLYRVMKTHLTVYYRHHITVTDQVCDAPTVRILNHILLEEGEHLNWGQAIYEELADTPQKRRVALEWQMELEQLLAESGGVTGGR